MKNERELVLEKDEENKGNYYYPKSLACIFGNLNVNVPRDRKREFRPNILPPPYQKGDNSFNDFILREV